jgi:hypothetical protein
MLARQKQKKLTTSSSKKKHKLVQMMVERGVEDARKVPTQKKCLLIKDLSSTTSSPVGIVNTTTTLDDLCKKQIICDQIRATKQFLNLACPRPKLCIHSWHAAQEFVLPLLGASTIQIV